MLKIINEQTLHN